MTELKDNGILFIDKLDVMADFLALTKDEFLRLYEFTTEYYEIDYDVTEKAFLSDKVGELASLMRQAENLYQDELNGRDTTYCDYTSEDIKTTIEEYAKNNLTKEEYEEYIDCCNAMGI